MKPSSFRTWATFAFRRLAGISRAGRSMALALRCRVRMSGNGSVIIAVSPSPARLADAGDQPVAGHAAEADPADAELAVHRPRPAAQLAPQPDLDDLARLQQLGLVALRRVRVGQFLLVRLQRLDLLAEAGLFRVR